MQKFVWAVVAWVMFASQAVMARDCTWIGPNVGTWAATANWEDGNVPSAAGDAAIFTNAAAMTAVTLDADVSLDRLSVSGTRLNLYSAAGKTVTFTGSAPEVAVAAGAALRASGVRLVSATAVKKTGPGKFITVCGASSGLRFASHEGDVELEGGDHADLAVIAGDGNWESEAHRLDNGAKAAAADPYGAAAGSLVVGNAEAVRSGVNGCRRPVFVGASFSLTADVEMDGSSAYGFAVAFHNDPRGHLAHMIHNSDYMQSLGYGVTDNLKDATKATKVLNGFAFGIFNYFSYDGFICFGTNGEWTKSVRSSPKIYTATRPADGGTVNIPRAYSVRIDYDTFLKQATVTLVQDQRGIVSGGQADVTWSQTVCGVDLVKLCGSDEAFLSFTFNEGGRNVLATLKNVRLAYPVEPATSVFKVSTNDVNWANRKCQYNTSNYVATDLSSYGSRDGSIRIGYGIALNTTVTGNKAKVPVTGNFRISGKVTDSGTGAHGFMVVLHNDPRGHLALSQSNAGGGSFGYAFGGSAITRSVAFGVFNFVNSNGSVRFGKNGSWTGAYATVPTIVTAPMAGSESPVQRQYDLLADFDATAKTLTLVLSQEQGGATAVSTNVFADVDVPALCGGNEAYLALTSEAGGRTIDVTVDDFKIVYDRVPEPHAATRFFASFASVAPSAVLATSSLAAGATVDLASATSFAADTRLTVRNPGGSVLLGEVDAAGSLTLASAHKGLRVVASDGLWENLKCNADGTDVAFGQSPYGAAAGSIRTGYNITMNGSVTGCRTRIPVVGDIRISGKVTDNGSGAHGYTMVLHNDPRGSLAHCKPSVGGDSLGYAREGDATRVVNSVGLGFCNYAGNNGKVRFGKNGVWSNTSVTNPKIVTAPRGDNHGNTEVQRKYDFAMTFDATAKTLTLVLSQVQGGTTVASTNVFAGVDVPSLCGDDQAYLTITSEAGGCSVDVTIDDFRVDYPVASPVTYAVSGAVEAPQTAVFGLADAILTADRDDAVLFDVFELSGAAAFAFDGAYRLSATKVWRDGVKLPYATYTSENCDWVTGVGSVMACGRGAVILLR